MYKTYTCRSDLSRRQRWLFGSRSGAETTDLELVLDPSEPNGSPIYVPVHACILVSVLTALLYIFSANLTSSLFTFFNRLLDLPDFER